jgi:soluble lytic murein transglycosylase-like protein
MASKRDLGLEARRAKYGPILDAAAAKHKIDPALLRAIAYVESRYNPFALGPPCGAKQECARGIVQLMPIVCQDLGIANPYDVVEAADGAAKLLARHLAHFGGKEISAIAAYNWGRANVDRLGSKSLPGQVKEYIARVFARRSIERADLTA